MTAAAVVIEGLSVRLGGVTVVDDVSFAVESGRGFGLVGESGAGKSTIALALLGLLPATAEVRGSIRVGGEEVVGRTERELQRLRGSVVSIVLQDPATALNPVWRVGAQVAEAVKAPTSDRWGAAIALLEAAGLDDAASKAERYPHELSGGQRQRVAIAIAMANTPALIVADEPTSALDPEVQQQVLDALAAARERNGAALLLISHDADVVAGAVDTVGVLAGGRLAEVGPVDAVLRRTPSPVREPRSASGEPVLTGEGLERAFGAVRAVDGVDVALHPGTTLGVVGESGGGKTTLARLLVGAEKPTVGTIRYGGVDVATLDRAGRRAYRREVQIVYQDPAAALDPLMTVGAAVAEPLRVLRRPRGTRGTKVDELLQQVGLDAGALRHRYPHELSAGQRQRVVIARALAMEPKVLLLDEPVSNLDASTRRGVLDLLAELQDRHGLAFLLVSHDHAVVAHLADRVVTMSAGRLEPR